MIAAASIWNDAIGEFTERWFYCHDQTRIQAKFQMLKTIIDIIVL